MTAIACISAAIGSYRYDMDPANGIDIMEGFGAVLIMMVGGFVVFYEIDLFYTVYYLIIKPKTIPKTVLNILSNLSLLLIFFSGYYKDMFSEDVIAPILVFLAYVALRTVYLILSVRDLAQKQ